ncbi:TPP-requiring enzyme co-localized with fatty acid metabolic genes [Amycolatopsis camponoti]|uniref:TPP-requiring enzyme co-localized with fatty acid metabolic genes n=1 Tax=Amycolatopsis camponoti TaxID=2606593 RepID=A0A6I8LUK7_9PSEU|nr:thiamine pyrophosphate-binding protein [Amycolatopsis camponoti]VVJ20413.1 TPP-requiring enzyme co-localized with fatty acid metabolic genes [Amycolatopsis camponoti]
MTTLAAAVAETIAHHGIRHAFGVVGNGNIYFVEALTGTGARYVPARHEGGAVAMAEAYYRTTGEVAVCTTTYGPGLTNVATGLTEAVKRRSPVLLVCGDAPVGRPPRPTDFAQREFIESLGARAVRVTDPATARETAADALELARQDRVPVVLCLPDDLLKAEVPAVPAPQAATARLVHVTPPAPGELAPVLEALAGARRPLVLAGAGAWQAGAAKILADLADELGGLLATTVQAAGLFAGHKWSVGLCGGFSSPRAAELIAEADVVLAFGATLNVFTLHGGKLPGPDATLVRIDASAAPAIPRVDLTVTGDAADVAVALLDTLRARGTGASGWRTELGELGKIGWVDAPFDDRSTADRIDPRALSAELARLLPPERTLVTDGGHFAGWPIMYLPAPDPAGLVFTGVGFQVIGLGFAGAVGAVTGRPDRTTVVALGDGGALMGLPDLETLVRTAESALVVVYDDAAYGWEVHVYGDVADPDSIAFADTDFAGLARAFGATAAVVRTVEDLDAVRAWLDRGRAGTLVLDCKVVPDVVAGFLADLAGQLQAGGGPAGAPGSGRAAA